MHVSLDLFFVRENVMLALKWGKNKSNLRIYLNNYLPVLFSLNKLIKIIFCSKMSCSVLPEHFLHVGPVKIGFINEMFEVNGLQVDGLKLWKLINFGRVRAACGVCWRRGGISTSAPVEEVSLTRVFLHSSGGWSQFGQVQDHAWHWIKRSSEH